MAVADLLAERRPHRADAARNFDAILAAGRKAFAAGGTEVSLDEIARHAGVGVATLYRNFPSREDLVEAVYVTEVDELCRYGERLAGRGDPWDALVSWLRRFVSYLGTKRILLDALDRESGAFRACRDALYVTGEPLLGPRAGGRPRSRRGLPSTTCCASSSVSRAPRSAPGGSGTASWRWRSPGLRPDCRRARARGHWAV